MSGRVNRLKVLGVDRLHPHAAAPRWVTLTLLATAVALFLTGLSLFFR
jgi:hypothetical protein